MQKEEVVIPMIAFIEGGMRISIGTITRDYLRAHKLAPIQCAPNENKGLGLTYHDVNWIYNLHHLKGQGYYQKFRYLEVRLIQFLPDSNKGLNKDFLIILGE